MPTQHSNSTLLSITIIEICNRLTMLDHDSSLSAFHQSIEQIARILEQLNYFNKHLM